MASPIKKIAHALTRLVVSGNLNYPILKERDNEEDGVSVKYTTKEIDGIVVVDAEGHITLGEGSTGLRNLLHDQVSKGHKNFVINVGGVSYIDSSGIGEMMSGASRVHRLDGKIKLVALNKRARDVLALIKLGQGLQTYDTTEEAILSFKDS